MELFADDSSIFTQVDEIQGTQRKIERDLGIISAWAHQWKMIFNPGITKQAVEVIFSVRKHKTDHPELTFNDVPVAREKSTKHLGVYLDERLSFSKHIRETLTEAEKGISLLKCISKYVSRKVLDMTYKFYIKIYQNQRADLMHLVEQTQYKAGLVVSGCRQGTSRKNIYKELGWESLTDRWFHRMTLFYKISNWLTPYLADHIPRKKENSFNLRTKRTIATPPVRTARFSNSFFPYCSNQRHNLDDNIKCLSTLQLFKKHLITYIRPPENSLFEIQDKIGIVNKN